MCEMIVCSRTLNWEKNWCKCFPGSVKSIPDTNVVKMDRQNMEKLREVHSTFSLIFEIVVSIILFTFARGISELSSLPSKLSIKLIHSVSTLATISSFFTPSFDHSSPNASSIELLHG